MVLLRRDAELVRLLLIGTGRRCRGGSSYR